MEIILNSTITEKTQICVCTDSLGACKALLTGDMTHVARPDIITDILLLHEDINKLGIKLQIIWIPSHVNIDGNEIADKCANEGRMKDNIEYNQKLGYSELVSLINNEIHNQIYQKQYSNNNHATVAKFRKTFPNAKCKIKLDKDLYLLNRIRTRADRINHFNDNIFCRVCRTKLTSKHAIKNCTLFDRERDIAIRALRYEHLEFKIKNITKPDLKADANMAIMNLLRKIDSVFKI